MKRKSSGKRKEPGYGVMRHERAILAKATEEQQRRILEGVSAERLLKWDADFEEWAHRNQLPPSGEGWRTWWERPRPTAMPSQVEARAPI